MTKQQTVEQAAQALAHFTKQLDAENERVTAAQAALQSATKAAATLDPAAQATYSKALTALANAKADRDAVKSLYDAAQTNLADARWSALLSDRQAVKKAVMANAAAVETMCDTIDKKLAEVGVLVEKVSQLYRDNARQIGATFNVSVSQHPLHQLQNQLGDLTATVRNAESLKRYSVALNTIESLAYKVKLDERIAARMNVRIEP